MSPTRMRPGNPPIRTEPARPFRTQSPKVGAAPLNLSFVNGVNPALPPGYFAGTPCLTNPAYAESFYCGQYRTRQKPSFGAAAFAPIYWITPMDYGQTEETPPPQTEPENGVAAEVQNLTNEVEMLREEQSSRMEEAAREAEPRALPPEKPLKTVLVYRDGHKSEVQDYAIVGNTLWVFAGQTTKRVPLADLDLKGTRKLNDDRGVDFGPSDAL